MAQRRVNRSGKKLYSANATRDVLPASVERASGCRATFLRLEPVTETHDGRVVWDGEVHVFALTGHPTAKVAYAWTFRTDAGKDRTLAILGVPPINSARDAVRAAIASGQQE